MMKANTAFTIVCLGFLVLTSIVVLTARDLSKCNATDVAHQVLPK